jgi:hypothetical protein
MNTKSKRTAGFAFLAIGIALGAVGISGQQAFVGVGVVFLCLGIILIAQSRGEGPRDGRKRS